MVSYYDSFYCQLNTLGWVEHSVGNINVLYCNFLSCCVFCFYLVRHFHATYPIFNFYLDEPLYRRYKSHNKCAIVCYNMLLFRILFYTMFFFPDSCTAYKTAHPVSVVSCCILFLAVIIWLILSYSVLSVHNTCHSA